MVTSPRTQEGVLGSGSPAVPVPAGTSAKVSSQSQVPLASQAPPTSEPPESFGGREAREAYRYLWNKLFYPAPPPSKSAVFSVDRRAEVSAVLFHPLVCRRPKPGSRRNHGVAGSPRLGRVGEEVRWLGGRGASSHAFLRAARGHGTRNRCRRDGSGGDSASPAWPGVEVGSLCCRCDLPPGVVSLSTGS